MRTTVTLDKTLVSELLKLSKAKTKTAAVAQAVREQIRRAKLRQLADLIGTVDIDERAINEGNEADMKRSEWLEELTTEKGN